MKNKDQLAIFDFDGTLFDTDLANYRAYQAALLQYDFEIKINKSDFYQLSRGETYKNFLPIIIKQETSITISDELVERIHHTKQEFYQQYLAEIKKNESLFTLIKSIRHNYQIAIVTTASRHSVMPILKYFDVIKLFDLIITSDDVTRVKPHPEGFLLAVTNARVSLKNTIVFEDSPIGIEAARRAGIVCLQIHNWQNNYC